MKKLILLLLFIPLVSFGQISISDLIKVAKMDRESFEIYALENGYSYGKSTKDGIFESLEMKKGSGYNFKFLEHITKIESMPYKSTYTGPQEGLVNIYKELKNLGFTVDKTQEILYDDGSKYFKSYIKNDELVELYITADGDDFTIFYSDYK